MAFPFPLFEATEFPTTLPVLLATLLSVKLPSLSELSESVMMIVLVVSVSSWEGGGVDRVDGAARVGSEGGVTGGS